MKLHNHSVIYMKQEKLRNEARFPKVNTVLHCSISSQLNNTHDHINIPLKQRMVSLSGGYSKPTYIHAFYPSMHNHNYACA